MAHEMTQDLIEQTISAIEVLNKQKEGDFHQAHEFLMSIHDSDVAWTIADQLLKKQKDQYSSYFGAETMKNKIQKHFEELPVESHLSLKQSLIEHLRNPAIVSNHTVSNQLSIALADLYCHMIKWESGINEIIMTFANADFISILLDILRYIPEEQSNKSLHLGVNRKTHLYGDLEKNRESVISVIDQASCIGSSSLLNKSIQCLTSWYEAKILRDSDLLNCRTVNTTIEIIKKPFDSSIDETLFKSAIECCCTFFHHDIQLIPNFLKQFLQHLTDIETAYINCEQNNAHLCLDYTKLFCEIAYYLLPYVFEQPDFDINNYNSLSNIRTLNLLLLSARTNTECCTEVIYTLTEILESVDSKHIDQLSNLLEKLISEMAKFCTITQHDGDLESLCLFRQDVFNLMENLRFYINIDSLYGQMLNYLSKLLNDNKLADAEAVLYMLSSLVKYVNYDNNDMNGWTEQLISMIILPNVRNSNVTFKDVAFTMFGELSSWLVMKERYTDINRMLEEIGYFLNQLTLIESSVIDKPTKTALNAALHTLSAFIKRYPQLFFLDNERLLYIKLIFSYITQLPIVPKQITYLYESLGRGLYVISVKPHDGITNYIENIYNFIYEVFNFNWLKLENLDQSAMNNKKYEHTPLDPCVWIDNICGIYISMAGMAKENIPTENHKLIENHFQLFEKLNWSFIMKSLSNYINYGRVLERIVRLLRYIIRSLQNLILSIVPEIAEKIVEYYIKSNESCFLYLGGILIDEYSWSKPILNGLIQMYFALCNPVSNILCSKGLEENPNTAEDFFRLTIRILEHWQPELLNAPCFDLNGLLLLAIRGLKCTNIDTNELSGRLINEILDLSDDCNTNLSPKIQSWLIEPSSATVIINASNSNGLYELLSTIIYVCKNRSEDLLQSDGLLDDLNNILIHIAQILPKQYLEQCLDYVLDNARLKRSDGLMYVTPDQLNEFKNQLLNDNKDSSKHMNPLLKFTSLFI